MGIYPDKIAALSGKPRNARKPTDSNAEGVAAAFECGCFVRVFLEIETEDKRVVNAGFQTNGCGFAVAAAEILTEEIVGRALTEFRGRFESSSIREAGSDIRPDRSHCARIGEEALASALADFRSRQIAVAGAGESLVCSCFGVSESAILSAISENFAETVEEVGDFCRAGTGCGSCRMVIAELLDRFGEID